jgi:hypothetical protein
MSSRAPTSDRPVGNRQCQFITVSVAPTPGRTSARDETGALERKRIQGSAFSQVDQFAFSRRRWGPAWSVPCRSKIGRHLRRNGPFVVHANLIVHIEFFADRAAERLRKTQNIHPSSPRNSARVQSWPTDEDGDSALTRHWLRRCFTVEFTRKFSWSH